MNFRFRYTVLISQCLLSVIQTFATENLARRTWIVDGVTRKALVSIPAVIRPGGAPVVFAFHGHTGTMRQASRSFPIHQLWPEAIVVYPQGLPTPGPLVDPEGKESGWQATAGTQGDRDLKCFDAMLASLRAENHVDDRRVYATGHSNGGGFTYLLWAERGDLFAAFAPSAAVLAHDTEKFQPKPVLHIGSPQDPLVKFAWQERMIDFLLKLDGCGPRKATAPGYTVYPSSKGAEVATYLHSGGHRYPDEAPALIVKFFQSHSRP
jgi:polyhydroxybutyrate depolymerase